MNRIFMAVSIFFWVLTASAKNLIVTDNGPEVFLPNGIWEGFGKIEGKDSIAYSVVQVKLTEKTSGVLISPEVVLKLPRGGGQVDLAQYVNNIQGTFRVSFELEEMSDPSTTKAFFVSRTRKRKIDGEVWGSGCNKYVDIHTFFANVGRKTGIEVNTTRNRHISVLGGTFFFSAGPLVTQVTFIDSVQEKLFCKSGEEK